MSKGPTDESMCCCRLLLTELASRQESLNIRYADIYRVGRRAFMCYGCVAALMVMLSARMKCLPVICAHRAAVLGARRSPEAAQMSSIRCSVTSFDAWLHNLFIDCLSTLIYMGKIEFEGFWVT